MYEKILSDTFPGFLSIRNEKHQIIYLNDNFRNWIRQFTDVDPIGKTNIELAAITPPNVADTFLQCHDGSLDLYKKEDTAKGIKKILEFKSQDNKPEHSQYFDVFKYIVMIGGTPHIYTIAYDITDLFKENRANLYSSITDSLTKAYNRRYLELNIRQFSGHRAVMLDLDNFKMINDHEGHKTGDYILSEFANMLRDVKEIISVVRIGGDEFLAILTAGLPEEEIVRLFESLREEFEFRFRKYRYLSFSYGIEMLTDNIEDTLVLIDSKMYKNKYERKINKKL